MKYTVLGRSGISVSRISMGTHHLNDPADKDKHVQNFYMPIKKESIFLRHPSPTGKDIRN